MSEKCKYCGATETDHSVGGWGCQRRGLINGLDTMTKERDKLRKACIETVLNCIRCENGLVEIDNTDGEYHHEPCPCCNQARAAIRERKS